MGFSFQINNDLEFKHDEYLLGKAEKLKPELRHSTISALGICQLVADETKLEGWTTKLTHQELKTQSYQKDDIVILDFGTHYVGKFSIDINSVGSPMDAPLYIRFRFAEVPAELAHQNDEYDGWLARGWIQEEFIHLDELPCHLELHRRYSFRYVEIKVIDTSPKWQAVFTSPLVVTEGSADETQLKVCKIADKQLNDIYNVSLKTLQDCMTDVFEDGPKRDRRLWLGDLRLQALANYCTYDNVELVKRCLYLFAAMTTVDGKIPANVFVKPKNIPDDTFLLDYSVFFISTLYDFLQIHPEKEILDDLYGIAKKQIDIILNYVDENGKFNPDEKYPVFVDWSDQFNKDTCGQAIVIYGLKQFITLTQDKGEETSQYHNILDKMISYSKNYLYNQEKHLFITTNQEVNIASQVWMVLADILTYEENQMVMKESIKNLFPVKNIATPYMYHHITEALFQSGLQAEAIDMIKSYWGKMIELGADTYWEAFDPDQPCYSPYGNPIISSYCHAWSCTPVYLINKYLK